MNETITKTRNWLCLVYPDSAPDNWEELINRELIPWIHSPLHAPDLSVDAPPEERRKPHYHCLFIFDGPKTFKNVSYIQSITNGTILIPCNSVRASIRYFVHLDQPYKQQFPHGLSELFCFNGAVVGDLCAPTSSEKQRYVAEMCQYIVQSGIVEFSDLCDYAMLHHYDDWWYCLNNTSTSIMKSYCTSVREKYRDELKKKNSQLKLALEDLVNRTENKTDVEDVDSVRDALRDVFTDSI